MARRSFKQRFLTPQVAQAIMSPLGIVLFGVGTAGAVLVGAPLAAAAGVGALVWGGRVFAAVPRDPAPHKVAPGTLGEPWRSYVQAARNSKNRFDDVVRSMTNGPLKDRLWELATKLEEGVAESGRIATRGNAISGAIGSLDTDAARTELGELTAQTAGTPPSPSLAETIRSLEAQVAAGDRLETAARQAADRLRLLDARFDELVARAVEVSLGTGDSDVLVADVDGLVHDLESLRIALDETNVASDTTMQLPKG
ncbi:MAG TPA: hypothetical protein VMM60_17485 [Ilumatobacter sp.]|nr:hypothetical protein [Ilumatobacter sp.]